MAGGRAIRAGQAFVEVVLRDKLQAGLQKAARRLKNFSKTTAAIGAGLSAAAGSVLGPLTVATRQFMSMGDSLDKMSSRVGASVEFLSALSHAASLGGTDISAMEVGIRRMQRTAYDATRGLSTATEAFADLGIEVRGADGQLKSTEQLFMQSATALSRMENNTKKAALATVIFGRAGTQLLPMLRDGAGGLVAAMNEAKRLGIVMSGEDATAAAALTDAWTRLTSVGKMVTAQLGAALAPVLTRMADRMAVLASGVIKFVKKNKQLVVWATGIAAAVAVAGTALVTIGGVAFAASMALQGLAWAAGLAATVIGGIASVVGFLLSPLGLVVAALAGGAAWWLKYSGTAAKATAWVKEKLSAMLAFVKQVMGGIVAALKAGDIALAARIAWLGVQVAFYEAMAAIQKGLMPVRGWIIKRFQTMGSIVTALLHGQFSLAGQIAWASLKLSFVEGFNWLKSKWITFTSGLATIWDNVVTQLRKVWNTAVAWIAKGLLRITDMIRRSLEAIEQYDPSGMIKRLRESLTFDAQAAIRVVDEDTQRTNRQLDEDRRRRSMERSRAKGEALAEMKRQVAELEAQRDEALAKARELAASEAGGTALDNTLDEKLAELNAAIEEAKQKKSLFDADQKQQQVDTQIDAGGVGQAESILKGSTRGTFSAAAVFGLAAGGVNDRLTRAVERTAENTDEIAYEARKGKLVFG